MTTCQEIACPGCGLSMPAGNVPAYDGYYYNSSECWAVYTELLGAEFSNALLFGQVHQMTVDTYAVQHTGGRHPDKSIDIHLTGLHLMLNQGVRPPYVARHLQALAVAVGTWPHFEPPSETGSMTVFDVALCDETGDHIAAVEKWARQLWDAWSPHHAAISEFAGRHVAVARPLPGHSSRLWLLVAPNQGDEQGGCLCRYDQ